MLKVMSNLVSRRTIVRLGWMSLAGAALRPLVGCNNQVVLLGRGDADAGDGAAPVGDAADVSLPDAARAARRSSLGRVGPLGPADANGLRLPEGFTSRVVAKTGTAPAPNGNYLWHRAPDGGATFRRDDGGWVYVSNAELASGGGVGALRFDREGRVIDAYPVLENTRMNCAGGPTPWNTWLSCEETADGLVYECDPFGARPAVARPALGSFTHEAAAVDPLRGHVYLSEDLPDGCFYRFTPTRAGDLSRGELEVAVLGADGRVVWLPIPDPRATGATPLRAQVPGATPFNGGEGLWMFEDKVYLSTKNDNKVWEYDVARRAMRVHYNASKVADPILRGVDNLVGTPGGDILVAEDADDMQVCAILPDGSVRAILQVVGHTGSEVTGIAFDPSYTRLYFSSQRAPGGALTFEVSGPFVT
jgi:hypothetical protein